MCQINQNAIATDLQTIKDIVNEHGYDPAIIDLAEQMEGNAEETLDEYEEQLTEYSSLESQLEKAEGELATQETENMEADETIEELEEELKTLRGKDLGEEYQLKDLMDLVRPHLNTYGFAAKLEAIKTILEGK